MFIEQTKKFKFIATVDHITNTLTEVSKQQRRDRQRKKLKINKKTEDENQLNSGARFRRRSIDYLRIPSAASKKKPTPRPSTADVLSLIFFFQIKTACFFKLFCIIVNL